MANQGTKDFILENCLRESNIATKEEADNAGVLTDVAAVSYPGRSILGTGAVPVLRRGIISHPCARTDDGDMILLDIATFPSYSGSPVFLADSVRQGHPKLLAIEKASPQLNSNGQFLHLSVAVSAYQLLCLKPFAVNSFFQ